MRHSRLAMLAVTALSVGLAGYWVTSGRPLQVGLSLLNAVIAGLVFRNLEDAPRAV